MFHPIVHSSIPTATIRQSIRQAPLVAIRQTLTDRRILEACQACGHRFRERLYGPVVTVLHFVAQALQREASFAATWQELFTCLAADFPEIGMGRFDLSGLTHARKRLPKEVMQTLATEVCQESQARTTTRWKGFRLLAMDATTASMPREAPLFAHFGRHRARTTTVRYPLGTFACLLNLAGALMMDYRWGPFDPGEMTTTLPLLAALGPGDLLLLDRHFSGSPFLARTYATGADFLTRKNARRNVDPLPVIQKLGPKDFLTELPMDKRARKADPTLPGFVRVRVFKATWKTPAGEKVTEWFMTSLTDAKRYPKRTLAELYHERWQIETGYHEFKCALHADVLRSKTVDNIHKEVAAHVLAYQIVRQLMVAAAQKHGKKPTEVSFLNAARWVVHFSHRMAAAPTPRMPSLYQALLDAIASSEVDVRPGRLEPRALTREWKHYPHLRTTRAVWRKQRLKKTA